MASRDWSQAFTPTERHTAQDIEAVTDTLDWGVHSLCGLLAIFLFILAANRSRQGDVIGAVLSSLGGITSALAPILAKSFNLGG